MLLKGDEPAGEDSCENSLPYRNQLTVTMIKLESYLALRETGGVSTKSHRAQLGKRTMRNHGHLVWRSAIGALLNSKRRYLLFG